MMGAANAAKSAGKITEGLLAASAVGVAGAALVKTPASNQIKQQMGFGENTSMVGGAVTSAGISAASPAGQDYMPGSDFGGPTGTFMGMAAGGAAGGAVAGAKIFGGPGGAQGQPFKPSSGTPKTLNSKMLGGAKKYGKHGVNFGMKTASSGWFLKGIGVTAGAAAGASLVGDMVDRVARGVVKTGTPATRRLPSPKKSSKSAQRTSPTTGGVARNAGRGPGARGSPTMTGSTVLALHKTGGSGGVLT